MKMFLSLTFESFWHFVTLDSITFSWLFDFSANFFQLITSVTFCQSAPMVTLARQLWPAVTRNLELWNHQLGQKCEKLLLFTTTKKTTFQVWICQLKHWLYHLIFLDRAFGLEITTVPSGDQKAQGSVTTSSAQEVTQSETKIDPTPATKVKIEATQPQIFVTSSQKVLASSSGKQRTMLLKRDDILNTWRACHLWFMCENNDHVCTRPVIKILKIFRKMTVFHPVFQWYHLQCHLLENRQLKIRKEVRK